MTALEDQLARLAFDHWKSRIQTSMDLDQLMLVVEAYQAAWTRDDLTRLPVFLVSRIHSSEDLMARAVDASRADVQYNGPSSSYAFLREYALTVAFAASRLRYLQSIRHGRLG